MDTKTDLRCRDDVTQWRPTRERGRPACMHSRCVSLSFPAIRSPATLPAGTPWVRPRQRPGAIAGRVWLERRARLCREHCGRDAPPGSAGVSPACTAAAYRAERLRWCTRQPRRQKRREPGQSRALARLPVESRWRRRASCAETNAGETPALPGGRPAPVATLPPRDSGPTLPLSVPKTLQFSMPKTPQFSMPIETTAVPDQTPPGCPSAGSGVRGEPRRLRRCGTVAWGGVFSGKPCVPGRVLAIRRIRGWVGAGPKRPRVDTRGYTRALLCSSIRMACKGRFRGRPTSTAASQLSRNPQCCRQRNFFWLRPGGCRGILLGLRISYHDLVVQTCWWICFFLWVGVW